MAGVSGRVDLARAIRLALEAAFPLGADHFATRDRSPSLSFSLPATM